MKTLRLTGGFLGFCAGLGAVMLAGTTMDGDSVTNALTLCVKTVEQRSDPMAIQIVVELKNTSDQTLKFSTLGGPEPFVLRIVNAEGVDLNRHRFDQWEKDRTDRSTVLCLAPKETKRYAVQVTVVRDAAGKETRLPAGAYNVGVALPVVPLDRTKSRPTLVKSSVITVLVEE